MTDIVETYRKVFARKPHMSHAMALRELIADNKRASVMTDQPTLGSALLSLLVAADQHCPAIIGAAHLMYYARSVATPESRKSMVAQLKRDAADLNAAVAAVEQAFIANTKKVSA